MQDFDFDQTERLLYRISGPEGAPVVVYVPGIHGDWTPMWRLRELLAEKLRLVEVAYPRAPEWDLGDYGAKLLALLDELGIGRAHLLAESFGSLVGWRFTLDHPDRVRSIILAGGFCRTPGRVRVAAARVMMGLIPARLFDKGIDFYLSWLIRNRLPREAFRREDFFPASRTRRGHQAATRRLRIIRQTDVRQSVCELRQPVLYFGGGMDWVVPVRRETAFLKRTLHARCGLRCVVIPGAPHAILPARYREAAALIKDWVREHESMETPR